MNNETTANPKKQKKSNLKSSVNDIVMVSLFTALIAICSQIIIPSPTIPFTLQTLAIFIAGGVLGCKKGTLSIVIYIILGIIGIPVFAQFSSGLGAILGMTGGYIIGFVFTAFITGLMCEKLGRKFWVLILSMALGLLVCYAFGTAWFIVIYSQKIESIGLWSALSMCVFPFLIFDAAKIACAAIIVNRLDKIIKF